MPAATASPLVPVLKLPYFALLDALRGFAALAVACYHLTFAFRVGLEHPHPGLAWTIPLVGFGWFGVDAFFLMSGYGLAAKLADRTRSSGPRAARSFVLNRAWRIYPVYWLCCLLVLAVALIGSRFNHTPWQTGLPSDLSGVLAAALLVDPALGTAPLLPVVTWTLNCELGFYLLVAGGILLRARCPDWMLLGGATLLAWASALGGTPTLGVVFNFWPHFTCGLLVFAALSGGREKSALVPLCALAAIATAAACCGQLRLLCCALLGFALVAVNRFDARLARISPVRWLAWCGKISFPFFLLHVPLGTRIINLGRRVIPADTLGFSLVLATAVAFTLLASWGVHRCFEQPLLAFGRRTAAQPA